MEKYPPINNSLDILVAPTMEIGPKDFILQKFGSYKTKELLTFDEGNVEQQAPIFTVVRLIATALERLDAPGDLYDEGE